ncbi:MAG TPA: winged helix DNA-binding domain-containing protein [Vicinamibacterales bacterium]|jgi:hypothetical protein|nr:winged helix DNA-binding domain-containing protein [Vicinamibacterales bacterium]
MNVAYARLRNQGLSSGRFTKAADVVSWLGAVQAQEYPGARWALALRMRRATDAAIERTFAAGEILRTHVLRPTWHFVAPADIRWMLALTAPRVRAATASYDRRLGIDASVIERSNKAIARALKGGRQLTRQELKAALQEVGVAADGTQRLAHLVMHAELDAVVCSGALRGKQFTYALLDERAPGSRVLPRDEALAELTRRYFTSHGPAQLQDFVWWSGLTTRDVRAGLEMAARHLADDVIDGKRYWFSSSMRVVAPPARAAHLLPPYDEYLIAYKDRSAALDAGLWKPIADRDPFSSTIVVDGQVVGGWRAIARNGKVTATLDLPVRLKKTDERLIADAVRRFAAFLDLQVDVARR